MLDILTSVDDMFDAADISGNGVLTYDQFEFFMRNYTDHDIHEIMYCFDSMILMVVR